MIIGIDIGSTTTKAVSIEAVPGPGGGAQNAGRVIHRIKTKAADAVTSAAGAFGKMLLENHIKMEDIQRVMITGAGSAKMKSDLFGIPTRRVNEIQAIGIGGMYLAGKDNIIITNVGTGTVIIDARSSGRISHLGGSGVGGGTILGLAKKLLSTSDFNDVMALAETGSLNRVDLLLEDIMETDLSFLKPEATVSNFGKMQDGAGLEDIALGIVSMVYQVIGVLSAFAARSRNTNRVVVTGNGSKNSVGKRILTAIEEMYAVRFEYPSDAEYTTAIGAGLYPLE
ncbi:MAG: pantothenate kinase [Treponema sp.]|jgi:type II pantothenate kinase|nr:pantothenate kinase [Treponema sp.]